MKTWIIEPRDPLIVRDGRPFGPTPGARARTLPFPFPSTTAGGARTNAGCNESGVFDTSEPNIRRVLSYEVHGPFLVRTEAGGDIVEWYFPAPADALVMDGDRSSAIRRYPLAPISAPPGALTNLPATLHLVGTNSGAEGKPARRPPVFWSWGTMHQWLLSPRKDAADVLSSDIGIAGPTRETRMHVNISGATLTAEEGALFQTQGLEFVAPVRSGHGTSPGDTTTTLSEQATLSLALYTDGDLREMLAPLGGERRIVRWRRSTAGPPSCPEAIAERVSEEGACRVVLATPAYLVDATSPAWLCQHRAGITPVVRAVAVQRPQTVSGWDFRLRLPKPSRRLAPAGTVFWLELGGSKDERRRWVESMWLQPVSDDYPDPDEFRDAAQYRRDGFGVALIGTWDGQPIPMEV